MYIWYTHTYIQMYMVYGRSDCLNNESVHMLRWYVIFFNHKPPTKKSKKYIFICIYGIHTYIQMYMVYGRSDCLNNFFMMQ